ncbi:MAG: DUF2058 family protein [Gammaproteobacteria bacterium]|nr:DUF2058 family protein [Gammaproteobacteria bacterium]
MTKSLQDQLLALGMVTKKTVKKADHDKRIERNSPPKGPSVQESLAETQAKAREAKKAKDQALARERDEKRARAERLAQTRDLVLAHAVSRGVDADRVEYRFPYGKKIRPFPVAPLIRDGLAVGRLGLIEIDRQILIVPREILERARDRVGDTVFSYLAAHQPETDDGYPPIPDDLDW